MNSVSNRGTAVLRVMRLRIQSPIWSGYKLPRLFNMQHPLKFPFVIILLECYVYVYVSFKMLIIKNGSILSNVVQT